jgi:hypothetical protein
MKTNRVSFYLLAHALLACALSFPTLAQNVQTTDERISTPGDPNGPGNVPIDIEPNSGDTLRYVYVYNNLSAAASSSARPTAVVFASP